MAGPRSRMELFKGRSLRREAFRKLKKHDVKSSSFDGIQVSSLSGGAELQKNEVRSSSFDGSTRRLQSGSR